MCVSKTPEDDIADYWLDVRAVGRGTVGVVGDMANLRN